VDVTHVTLLDYRPRPHNPVMETVYCNNHWI
jgi:hypothetical protein